MKLITLAIALITGLSRCNAQNKPTEDCSFAYNGFATTPGQKVEIAEVAKRGAVQLEVCGSPKGCAVVPAARGTPIQIYRQQREWTCGYVSARDGAGSAWIRTDALRVLPYSEHPPLGAWVGTWIGGGDHIQIRKASAPGTCIW